MKIKVSIVTVTYNCENIVEDTILSIINQDYNNVEWIVVDGQSTDSTLQIFDKYKSNISKIISEPDKGIYDAMNKGIDLVTGDYVHFMNAGDVFVNNQILSTIFNNEENNSMDVIFGDAIAQFNGFNKIFKGEMPNRSDIMNFNHQAVFVRTKWMKKIKFDLKFKICADRNFFTKLFLTENVQFKYLNINIAKIEAIGFSSSNSFNSRKEDLQIKKENMLISDKEYRTQINKGKVLYFIKSLLPKRILNFYYKRLT